MKILKSSIGNGMKMAPNAKLNDGLLDLVLVEGNISKTRLLTVMPQLFKGTHINDSSVTYYQVPSFSLITKTNDSLNIDGELKGETPINVKVIPSAIEVFN